jgi:hypothetical protein
MPPYLRKVASSPSSEAEPRILFWPLLFNNVVIRLLGSDDFAAADKRRATADLATCLTEGRLLIEVAHRFSLGEIAAAHEAVERPRAPDEWSSWWTEGPGRARPPAESQQKYDRATSD